eukprot:TRINITY_DN293_c0_g1_i10.p3 TRINITY_DN293_c0_g1~~TRINITY_DN293_c0_g1_i10.p3  ORF type:complete len:63 (-),score=4.15 TRINITY_DN293_c0_g1_i10:1149-1337(-)
MASCSNQASFERGKYILSFLLNNKVVHSVVNTKAHEFNKVKVYVGDPWYSNLNGSVKNIRIV